MKKMLCILCCLFLVCSCSFTNEKVQSIEITPRDALDKIQDPAQNSFLLYLTTEDCYTCEEYTKVVKEIQKETPFDIYYINLNLDEEDSDIRSDLEELNVSIGDYKDLPTTYYFYQGNLLPENKRNGYIEKEEFQKWLKVLHILK